MARARCRALLTEATELSSSSATSLADQQSTSRRISTARCRGASRWSAETNASRTDSRATAVSAGSPARASTRSSGTGPIQVVPGSPVPIGLPALDGETRSIGRARRLLPLRRSRQTLVAMRWSQERREAWPSKRSWPRQARTMVSWTASSASNAEPSIR